MMTMMMMMMIYIKRFLKYVRIGNVVSSRGSRGVAPPFRDYGTRRGLEVSVTPRPLFTPGKNPVSIVQEAGLAPGPVWTGAENLASHRDSIP